jgi:hypothetical protein
MLFGPNNLLALTRSSPTALSDIPHAFHGQILRLLICVSCVPWNFLLVATTQRVMLRYSQRHHI